MSWGAASGKLTVRRARRGLWGAKKIELPGDYKKRVREGGEVQETKQSGKESWWHMMGRWLGGKT